MNTASGTCTAKVKIQNRLGLHARPAMSFVDKANEFQSVVLVRKGDFEVDGKSIMHMMMLAATMGTELDVVVEGPDATQALAALVDLVNRKFDEAD
jgi:phosphocarrier protein HPr